MEIEKSDIHKGHRKRMKERFIKYGAAAFETHELLEMLLYPSYPRQNTNEIAHKILDEYNDNLSLIFEADTVDIMRRCKISENVAMYFAITSELMHRSQSMKFKKKMVIDSSDIAGGYAVFLLSKEKRECFYIICLDAQSRLIGTVFISRGSIGETQVYFREIVEAALKYNARCVILAHNHPGGSLVPSPDDIQTTSKIVKLMNMMDIFVMDHIIVSDDKYLSLNDEGFIENNL